jgi:hypothetical protein
MCDGVLTCSVIVKPFMWVYLIMYLTAVYLMGVYLTGVHLMSVHLTGVHLMITDL